MKKILKVYQKKTENNTRVVPPKNSEMHAAVSFFENVILPPLN